MNKESKLLFIVATHGNEGFSIPVLQRLEQSHPKDTWGYDWIIGNPRALALGERFTDCDLNRSAPGNERACEYERRRAAEILKISDQYDLAVDIHGTLSPCGLVTIIPKPSLENSLLALLFPSLVNIIWNSVDSIESGPLTQFMNTPAIELECEMNNSNFNDRLYRELIIALEIKQKFKWLEILKTIKSQSWFQVVDTAQKFDPRAPELQPVQTPNGIRYPFLTNRYLSKPYYLLEKIKLEDKFLNA